MKRKQDAEATETMSTETEAEAAVLPEAAGESGEGGLPAPAPDNPAEGQPQGPPDPMQRAALPKAPEMPPPKAYIRPMPDAGSLSYGRRAAIYLSDKDEYRSMIGGNKQWK